MSLIYIDTETYCDLDLKTVGAYVYADSAELLLVQYAVDEGAVYVEEHISDILISLLLDTENTLVAHNSNFDRLILSTALRRANLPDIAALVEEPSRWLDTAAIAASLSLPRSLAEVGEVLGLSSDFAKKDGDRLIRLFSCPRPKNALIARADKTTHPEDWAQFVEYAEQDIIALREVYKRLPKWNCFNRSGSAAKERDLFWLDQEINDRGMQVDLNLAEGAVNYNEKGKKILAEEAAFLTNNALNSTSQVKALRDHLLNNYDLDLPDLSKATVKAALNSPDLHKTARRLLEIRSLASATSTSKFTALIKRTNWDRRIRGTLRYCGAARTGRWAGSGFQPQNLKRPTRSEKEIDMAITALKSGVLELLHLDPIDATSDMIRGCIIASKGNKLVATDLSNIEGRVLAWLANEKWKIKAFADFDAGNGPDLYKLAYARSFKINPDAVTKDQRQIGKTLELSMGYQGGVGAFQTFATAYDVDLDQLAERALPDVDAETLSAASAFYEMRLDEGMTGGLSKNAFIACDALKRLWRMAHPAVVNLWREIDEGVREIIRGSSKAFLGADGKVKVDKADKYLRVRLPSGRYLCYYDPHLVKSGNIGYFGQDSTTKKWTRIDSYGGKLVENIVQAIARDVLANGMLKATEMGYDLILTVHDEIVAEVEDSDKFSHTELSAIIATPPIWALNLPLAAEGYESYRYRK